MREAIRINLDVLTLNKETCKQSLFRWWNLNFEGFSEYRTTVQDALNGNTLLNEKDLGAYLHMTLPRNLRTSENGVFPLIPNRWLVIRTCGPNGGDFSKSKAVIIESDCPSDNGTLFLLTSEAENILKNSKDDKRSNFKKNIIGENESMSQIILGKVFDFDGWEERAAKDVFLTASENGDIMFSAYCFRNLNILSYFDPLENVPPSEVNYFVVGWLSSDENAPLYFASSTGIKWDKESSKILEGDPYFKYDEASVNVALGANINDAFLALMETKLKLAKIQEADKIISAFSALLGDYTSDLEKPNASSLAASHKHTARFSVKDTALRFYSEDGNSENLIGINTLCSEIENLQKSIISKREQLWLNFWKYHFYEYIPIVAENMTGKEQEDFEDYLKADSSKSVILPLINDLKKLNNCHKNLENMIKPDSKLKSGFTKRYYKPLSPSVVVFGVDSPPDIDPDFNGYGSVELNPEKCEIPNMKNLCGEIAALINFFKNETQYQTPHKQPYAPIYLEWQVKYVNIPFDCWKFDGFRYNLNSNINIADFENEYGCFTGFGGISPLSGSFEELVKSKFAVLGESLGKSFNNNFSSLAILSQDMTGFTEAVAQRDIRPFGVPVAQSDKNDKVKVGQFEASFGNMLGFDNDEDTLSPDWFPKLRNDNKNGTPYFDLRSGGFYITDLIIYDKFGRKTIIIDSSQQTGTKYAPNYPLIFGDTMRGQKKYALLPPSFLMDTTLVANIKLSCFITNNIVNESIIIHGSSGEYLGEIAVTSGKPVWLSASADIKIEDKIDKFIKSVVGNGSDMKRFKQITNQIEKSLSTVGDKPASLISATLGRPMAMLEINLSFDFYGKPYSNINWTAEDDDKPTYWNYDFPFSIGDPNEREDGFVAAFAKEENKNDIYEVMTESGAIANCKLKVNSGTDFMAICIPDTFFTVRTGILPAFKFRLPEEASLTSGIEQRIDVNNAMAFLSKNDANEKDIYMPAQTDSCDISFKIGSEEFPVAAGIKEDAVPIIYDGVILRKPKQ